MTRDVDKCYYIIKILKAPGDMERMWKIVKYKNRERNLIGEWRMQIIVDCLLI